MEMTPERWEATSEYLGAVFGREDADLKQWRARASAAGLPDIAVSSEVGRLLKLLASMVGEGRGARVVVEVGTLGGYSGIWLARGMAADGRLITIEMEEKHAAFAEREFARAGVADRVEVRRGKALEVLPRLAGELGHASVDLAFIDAAKSEYGEYYRCLKPMIRVDGLFVADNVLGSGSWWIDERRPDADREAVDRFNRMVAADEDFEAAAVPVRQGVMVARKVR